MYTDAEGQLAVRMARATVDAYTRGESAPTIEVPASFHRENGVFVTINTYPAEELRGCIGYPSPIFPLAKAILKASEGACEDPRFPRLAAEELDAVVLELLPHDPVAPAAPALQADLVALAADVEDESLLAGSPGEDDDPGRVVDPDVEDHGGSALLKHAFA